MIDEEALERHRGWLNHPRTAKLRKKLRTEVDRLSDVVCRAAENGESELATRAALRRHALLTVLEEMESG